MKSIVALLLFAFVALARAGGGAGEATYGEDSPVVTLTDDSFDDFVNDNEVAFVEFFAPWCGHCKSLKPEYESAAQEAADEKLDVKFGALDASEGSPHGQKHGVRGFPTIKLFVGGAALDYEGPRTGAALLEFAKKMSGPAVHESTAADIKALTEKNAVTVAAFLKEGDDKNTAYDAAAKSLRVNYELFRAHDSTEHDGLVVFVDGLDAPLAYDGEWTSDAIVEWVTSNAKALVDELGQQSWQNVVSVSDNGSLIIWLDTAEGVDNSGVLKVATGIAKSFLGKVNVLHADGVQFARFRENVGIDKLPGACIMKPSNGDQFVLEADKEVNEASLTEFVESYLAGKLVRVWKSEPVPESNDGALFKVVHDNFDEAVLGFEGKGVFVKFYAPWCGHCKKLAPIYEEVAEHFADNASIRIAEMDLDANELEKDYGVKGFPTLIWFPSGDADNFVTFSGAREKQPLVDFVLEQTGEVAVDGGDASKDEL